MIDAVSNIFDERCKYVDGVLPIETSLVGRIPPKRKCDRLEQNIQPKIMERWQVNGVRAAGWHPDGSTVMY